MSSDDLRFLDPWGQRWLTAAEFEAVLAARVALSRTWRYRMARVWQRLLRRPVSANTYSLVQRHDSFIAHYMT